MKRFVTGAGALAISAALTFGGAYTAAAAPALQGPAEHHDMGVTGDKVMAHLKELSDITLANKDTGFRSMGSPGYEEAAKYVEGVFKDAGLTVERQYFTVPNQEFDTVELAVDGKVIEGALPLSYTEGTAEPLVDVPLSLPQDDAYGDGKGAELGCAAADFADIAKGSIVLVSRGECAFADKVKNASEGGAAGVIVANTADEDLNGTLGERMEGTSPAVSVKLSVGEQIRKQILDAGEDGLTGSLTLETEFTETKTFNILAETPGGDPDNVQMMGSHLDSVTTGPGINDNASGVAALLAVAEGIAAQDTQVDRKVRFGVWGAEEVGLVGSTEYVYSLPESERKKIGAYLNYDMIGSNNYVVATLDSNGDYVPVPDDVKVPEGSVELEKIYTDYFDKVGQAYVGSEFSGRSDYQAFMDNGIPVGGLFSGADAIKTEKEVELFGGEAGVQQDTNYHKMSDTYENVNRESVDIFAPAIGYAAHVLAFDLVDSPEPTEDPSDDPSEAPAPEPTDEPSAEPAPSEEATDEPADNNQDDNKQDDGKQDDDAQAQGDLPRTGGEIAALSGAGALLVLIGAAAVLAVRRRSASNS